jgi:rare lipoprotein A
MTRMGALAAAVLLALPLASRPGDAPVPAPVPPALWQAPGRPVGIVLASWYGPGFAGRLTASGAPYDPDALTCAHPTLPLGTRLRAIRLDDGRSVELTVNDHGPYWQGRGLDVSRAAARALGFQRAGLCALRLEVIP